MPVPDSIDDAIDLLGGTPTTEELILDPFVRDFDERDLAAAGVARAMAGGSPGGSGGWPVSAMLLASCSKANTNWDNIADPSGERAVDPFGMSTSDNANGASIEWDAALAAGTYGVSVKTWPWTGGAIVTISLNDGGGHVDIDQSPYGASSASADSYDAASSAQHPPAIVARDVVIAESGVYTVRARNNGKNASSSGFTTNLVFVHFWRVAA